MKRNTLILLCLFIISALLIILQTPASAMTVQDVVTDLQCPCECPLVLEDCNMSCGLDWKEQVGQMISQGKSKQEIIQYFVDKYGDEARITPMARVRGKIFKYTRAFGTGEWALVTAVAVIWLAGLFIGIYLIMRRLSAKSGKR